MKKEVKFCYFIGKLEAVEVVSFKNQSNMNENQNCVKKLLDTFQNKQKHFYFIFCCFACCMFYDLNSNIYALISFYNVQS